MEALTLRAPRAGDTHDIGEALGRLLQPRDAVILTGELGAGKTTFTQGVARGAGVTEHVSSPTFVLVKEYVGRVTIAHVDVYRLTRVQDVVDLALDEIGDGEAVLLVEWGDAIEELLPEDRLRVELVGEDPEAIDDTRRIRIEAAGPGWQERLPVLGEAVESWRVP
jgi:tRNA threonylcarbamoyladenosine biosynthesis protein TsaE